MNKKYLFLKSLMLLTPIFLSLLLGVSGGVCKDSSQFPQFPEENC